MVMMMMMMMDDNDRNHTNTTRILIIIRNISSNISSKSSSNNNNIIIIIFINPLRIPGEPYNKSKQGLDNNDKGGQDIPATEDIINQQKTIGKLGIW